MVKGVTSAVAVSVGESHSCALTSSGRVTCWGWNAFYQLGGASTADTSPPIVVPRLHDVVELTAEYDDSCARTASGTVTCWGENTLGQAGENNGWAPVTVGPRHNPAEPLATWSAFIDRQYRDFAGRAPTSAETSTWAPKLAAGTVTAGDLVSTLVDVPFWSPIQSTVIRLYRAYFLRMPDIGGLRYWATKLRSGTSIAAASSSFAGSNEFKTRYGSLTNRKFVELVYTNVLGRPGDAGGINYWTGQLDKHAKTRGGVMVGFSESNENKRITQPTVDLVNILTGMLQRMPNSGELALWAPLLANGVPRSVLAADVQVSTEYAQRLTA